MNRPLLAGVLLVTGAAAAIGAVGGYVVASSPEYAQVVYVQPVTKAVAVKQQECRDLRASKTKPAKDKHRIAGVVIGGMVGGVIGRQFGGGSGKTLATVAGAAGGAVAGNQIRNKVQEENALKANGRKCRVVRRIEQQIVAYDVSYRFDRRLGTVRMEHAPGERIPVRDGKLVLPQGPEKQEKG